MSKLLLLQENKFQRLHHLPPSCGGVAVCANGPNYPTLIGGYLNIFRDLDVEMT